MTWSRGPAHSQHKGSTEVGWESTHSKEIKERISVRETIKMATDLERRIEEVKQIYADDRKECPKCKKETLLFWDVYARPIGGDDGQEHQLNLLYQCENCGYQEEVVEASCPPPR